MNQFLLFTGAGFSKSLDKRFPLTDQILDDLNSQPSNLDYLYHYLESARPNIEDLARAISIHYKSIQNILPILSNRIEYSKQLRLRRATKQIDVALLSTDVQDVRDYLEQCAENWQGDLDHIHEQVLEPMLKIDLTDPVPAQLKQFITNLTAYCELNIFTTNYDRAIRQVQHTPDYYLSHGGEVDLNEIIKGHNLEGYCYIPLKGMLDWGISNKKHHTIYQTSEHDGRVPKIADSAVMPLQDISGFQKWPHALLYNKFREELQSAKYICFIGFSFRDKAINEAIKALDSAYLERIVIFTKAIDDKKAKEENQETEEEFQKRVMRQTIPERYHSPEQLSFMPLPAGFQFDDTKDFVRKYFMNLN